MGKGERKYRRRLYQHFIGAHPQRGGFVRPSEDAETKAAEPKAASKGLDPAGQIQTIKFENYRVSILRPSPAPRQRRFPPHHHYHHPLVVRVCPTSKCGCRLHPRPPTTSHFLAVSSYLKMKIDCCGRVTMDSIDSTRLNSTSARACWRHGRIILVDGHGDHQGYHIAEVRASRVLLIRRNITRGFPPCGVSPHIPCARAGVTPFAFALLLGQKRPTNLKPPVCAQLEPDYRNGQSLESAPKEVAL